MRNLVKLALKCDNAEQMGRKLKQRFEKQKQRQGIGRKPDDAGLDKEFDRLLAD